MAVTTAAAEKAFRSAFEVLSRKQSYSDTFHHLLDFSLFMLKPGHTEQDIEAVSYLDGIYPTEEEARLMATLFNSWTTIADDGGFGFRDAFGDLFMDLVSHGRNGQYFTPQPICDMMAQITYGGQLQPGMSVCDPTCGSGRTLLAMAKIERRLKFYGADNDITCCKMSVLNMLVNSMEGEVAWMDSLSMEHFRSWHIQNMRVGGYYLPMLTVTGKGETNFIRRRELQQAVNESSNPDRSKPAKIQLTLF